MALYLHSTKIKPLLFFESFIQNEKLIKYEEMFFEYPINPSFESNRELGYIEYTKDFYDENEEFKPVREYFQVALRSLLENQIYITKQLLAERKDELEYQNIEADIFLKKQLSIIESLKENLDKITVCKRLVSDSLISLEKNIKIIVGNDAISIPVNFKVKTNNPFFEPKVKRKALIELYNIAIENGVIDEEVISEGVFLDVFMSNNPKGLENKIIFNVDNQKATFFLNAIIPLFNNLSHSQISKSESFYNKLKKLLTQRDLDTAKSRSKRKPSSPWQQALKSEIDKIIPKEK
jgi:hypothetical protein